MEKLRFAGRFVAAVLAWEAWIVAAGLCRLFRRDRPREFGGGW